MFFKGSKSLYNTVWFLGVLQNFSLHFESREGTNFAAYITSEGYTWLRTSSRETRFIKCCVPTAVALPVKSLELLVLVLEDKHN